MGRLHMAASVRTAIIVVGLSLFIREVYGIGLDETMVYMSCNDQEYPKGDPVYDKALSHVVNHLMHEVPNNGYSYYVTSPYTTDIVFGHAACNGQISKGNCRDCIFHSFQRVFECRVFPIGFQVQYQDCRMRSENNPFIE